MPLLNISKRRKVKQTVPIFIHSSVSHSACGNSASDQNLKFESHPNTQLSLGDQGSAHFYAMDNLAIDCSESRLFDALTTTVGELISISGLDSAVLSQTALLLGSTSLDIGTLSPDTDAAIGLPKIDRLSRHLQKKFGLSPFHMVINTACTASTNALLYGKKLIEHQGYNQVIVVGCEFYNHLTIGGFHSLDLLSKEQLKTFHSNRDGLILGEGIGALLLTTEKPAREYCYRVLEGYSGCDTTSLTMTSEDGSHIKTVLHNAVQKSGLIPTDIDLFKVHGTATYNNDIAEYNAILSYFESPPEILALKPFIGHTLGACGVIEIALMDYLLNQDELPLADYVKQQTKEMMLPFSSGKKALNTFEHVLINHCGFGGNNAALVLKVQQ